MTFNPVMALNVRRVSKPEFRKFFQQACATWDTLTIPYYTVLNLDFLGESWEKMMDTTARAYGLFDGENPVGILLGFIVPDLMTGEKHGIEYLWAVAPHNRRGNAAIRLLKHFERECRAENCVRIVAGSAAWSNMPGMAKLYERLGYQPHSVAHSKVL